MRGKLLVTLLAAAMLILTTSVHAQEHTVTMYWRYTDETPVEGVLVNVWELDDDGEKVAHLVEDYVTDETGRVEFLGAEGIRYRVESLYGTQGIGGTVGFQGEPDDWVWYVFRDDEGWIQFGVTEAVSLRLDIVDGWNQVIGPDQTEFAPSTLEVSTEHATADVAVTAFALDGVWVDNLVWEQSPSAGQIVLWSSLSDDPYDFSYMPETGLNLGEVSSEGTYFWIRGEVGEGTTSGWGRIVFKAVANSN